MDVLQWKLVPEKWGGGAGYIQKFKDSWVIIPTLAEIKRNTSYGDFIVKHWQRFNKLVSY